MTFEVTKEDNINDDELATANMTDVSEGTQNFAHEENYC